MSKQDGSNRLVSGPEVPDDDAVVLHVDLDAFFASASLLAHPELKGRPVVIGHDSARSVVTASTYEARKFGVYSAMSMAQAKRLCPHAIILEPDFAVYQRLSKQVMQILDDVSPFVERLGIDEAFVNIRSARKLFGGAQAIGPALRARIEHETGLTASIGAASTKFVAKLASQRAKPDGFLIVPDAEVIGFLHPQPVTALWGVGPAMHASLARYGIHTVAELANTPEDALRRWFGDSMGPHLLRLAWGRDARMVDNAVRERSIGHSHTFFRDITEPADMESELLRLGTGVGRRARNAGLLGRTVSITVRFRDFRTISRSKTLPTGTDVTRVIVETAWELLRSLGDIEPVRLLGVTLSNLGEPTDAATLWDDAAEWADTEKVMDALHDRFGAGAVQPASMLRRERKRQDTGR